VKNYLTEFIGTFFLVLTIGLAIGFTVVVGAFAGGGISGGAFNPAVGLGPILYSALTGAGGFGNLWLYLVGPLAGGAVGALVSNFQHADEGIRPPAAETAPEPKS